MSYRCLLSVVFLIIIFNIEQNETAGNPKASVQRKMLKGNQNVNLKTTKPRIMRGPNANLPIIKAKGARSKMVNSGNETNSKTRKTNLAKIRIEKPPIKTTTGGSKTFIKPPDLLKEDNAWYNQKSFTCTKSCWNEYQLNHQQEVLRTENCLRGEIVYASSLPVHYCPIRRLNTTKLANVKKLRPYVLEDTRIVCRPYNDRMGWYRGKQAVTVKNQPCLRWDSMKSFNFSSDDFNRFQSPSQLFSLQNSIVTVSDHHNYCRNPDNHELGPWCYVRNFQRKIIRNSCFSPCSSFSNQLCLRKNHFPYRLQHRAVKYEKYVPLELVDRIAIRKHNKVIDLKDILDVPHILNQISGATSAIRIGPLGIPFIRGFSRGHVLSTRKRCYQTGTQTEILGPWTPVRGKLSDLVLKFVKKSAKMDPYNKFAMVNMHPEVGHQLWKPCFPSCEDETIKCWPVVAYDDNFHKIQKLSYYGRKSTTFTEATCLSWPKVLEEFLSKRTASNKFLFNLLFNDTIYYSANNTYNHFLAGQGYLLNNNYCLDFARLLRPDKKLKRNFNFLSNSRILEAGPGCFISNGTLQYQPCYRPCSCSLKATEKPSDVLQRLCGEETAELCNKKVGKKKQKLVTTTEAYEEVIELSVGKAPLIVLLTTMIFPISVLTGKLRDYESYEAEVQFQFVFVAF